MAAALACELISVQDRAVDTRAAPKSLRPSSNPVSNQAKRTWSRPNRYDQGPNGAIPLHKSTAAQTDRDCVSRTSAALSSILTLGLGGSDFDSNKHALRAPKSLGDYPSALGRLKKFGQRQPFKGQVPVIHGVVLSVDSLARHWQR